MLLTVLVKANNIGVYMKKFVIFLSVFVLVFAVGCSKEEEKAEVSAAVAESVAAVETEPVVEEAKWPRTFVDQYGHEVVIPEEPKNITLLHNLYLEHFYLLDSDPKACALANYIGESVPVDKMLEPYMDEPLVDIGKSTNLEAILESEPDIIASFYSVNTATKSWDQLSKIAPVILLDNHQNWDDQLREVAFVVGKEEMAEEIIAEINVEIAAAKEVCSAHPEVTFALLRPQGKDLMTKSAPWYYETFGLTAPEGWPEEEAAISMEALAKMDPDIIAFIHNEAGVMSYLDSFANNSVWNNLSAVKNGQVHIWPEPFNSYGPLSMKLTAEYLTEIYGSI